MTDSPVISKPLLIPKKYFRTAFWSLLIGMALYIGIAIATDFDAVKDALVQMGAAGWGLVLGLALLSFLLRFLRWQMYLKKFGYSVPVGYSLAYYIGAFTFTTSPGKAGEAVKSLYLKRHGVAYTDSLAALFSELFLDVVAVVLLAMLAGLAFEQTRAAVIVMALLAIALLPLIHSRYLQNFLMKQGERRNSGAVHKLLISLAGLLRSSAVLLRSGPLYTGLAIGLLAWGVNGLAFWVVLQHLDIGIPMLVAISIVAISLLAGAASFLLGGLGSTEAVMGLLLLASGADTTQAVAATLIYRLGTLWFAIALGMVCLIVLGAKPWTPNDRPSAEIPVGDHT
jgi:uncharacterized protein (TIRG00374 family)